MKIPIKKICLFSLFGALVFVLKLVMSSLPNIEPVSLLLFIFALNYKKEALYITAVYVLLEILVYGFSIWSIPYLYVWAIFVLIASIISKRYKFNMFSAAFFAGAFGLLFEVFYLPVYIIALGTPAAFAMLIAGIYFDILHCIGNFVLTLILFEPLQYCMKEVKKWE